MQRYISAKNIKERYNLFDHQVEGVQFALENPKCIIAHEMGLGKSRIAVIAAGIKSFGTILVVCPASLKINWQREIKIIYPEDQTVIVSGTLPIKKARFPNASWIIINYDVLDKNKEWILEMARDGKIETLILDEAHYAKDTKTIRTKAVISIALLMKQVYCLSGTPVMNRPIELFSLLRAIKHPLAYSEEKPMSTLRKEYGKRYCGAFFHKLGYSGKGFWDEKGATRLPELREMTRGVFLRRTKDEVMDLPDKIVSVASCALTDEYQQQYDHAWAKYLKWVAEHPGEKDITNVLSAQALIELGKLKQVCSLSKVDRIVADIENVIEQEQKIIVFSQYSATINKILSKMIENSIKSVTLTGNDDSESRQQAVDEFQNNPDCKVFIANMKAGGVGITLTAASIVMFADMEWSPTIHAQCEDRAHRIGQTGTVNVYYYIADGTIEEDIIDILTAKQETIGVLTGGETIIRPFMERLIDKTGNR